MNAIVIPMFNEEKNVIPLVERIENVLNNRIDCDIVLLNDGSKDGTLERMREISGRYNNIKIVSSDVNIGFGKIVKKGIQYCLDIGYDILIFMDGDLTHDPVEIPKLIDAMDEADMVIGSRYVRGGGMKDMPLNRVLISTLGNIVIKLLLRLPVLDTTGGYRAVRGIVFKKINLLENSFIIQLEEVVAANRAGFRIKEIPITVSSRIYGTSKFDLSTKQIMSYLEFSLKNCLK